ncbi:hypothetical protein Tco_0584909, partial [Tanacetum coccineum]
MKSEVVAVGGMTSDGGDRGGGVRWVETTTTMVIITPRVL